MIKKHKAIFEDIYDIILKTPFEKEARKNMKRFLRDKECEWDGDNNIISLGKRFKFKLTK